MSTHLTDRQFWLDYWENKKDLVQDVSANNYFRPIFEKIINKAPIKNSIEIGGFPGYLSIYLKKYFQLQPTLLDYVVHEQSIKKLVAHNNLSETDITLIEADLFNYNPVSQYDLCLSSGFIEHFSDTQKLIELHVNFLKPGGTLFIIVPNFLGLNGWFNRTFDRAVYEKHFLGCMDKQTLEQVAKNCDLKEVKTFYYGKFSIWLENYASQHIFTKLFFKLTWLKGKVLTKLIPIESKLLSPYTVLIAKKN